MGKRGSTAYNLRNDTSETIIHIDELIDGAALRIPLVTESDKACW